MNFIILQARTALVIFLVLFSVAVLVSGASVWKITRMTSTYSEIKKEYGLERIKKYRTIEDADYLKNNINEYQSLIDQSVIGAVDRTIWLDTFELMRQEMGLTDLFYNIGQPEILPGNYGDYVSVQVVTIDLQIGFRHDEALFIFFDTLKNSLSVNYQVTHFDIDRVPPDKNKQEAVLTPPIHLIVTSQISLTSIVPISQTDEPSVQGV